MNMAKRLISSIILFVSFVQIVYCGRNLLGSYEAPYDITQDVNFYLTSPYSAQFPLKSVNPSIPASSIKVPICNHYAVNRGSIIYTPCTASYLVAADNFGAILPPNMCTGLACPTTGFNGSDTEQCSQLLDSTGTKVDPTRTTLFDQFCDVARSSTKRCIPIPNAAANGPQYYLSPPIFTATTNWCDPTQTVQPETPFNRVMLTSGDGYYPFSFLTLTETQSLSRHTCPGDNGYSSKPGPSSNDIVMQLCFPGCSSFQKPVTVTMNLKDQSKRKKEGDWLWKLGVWDFGGSTWQVLCDETKTQLNFVHRLDVLEVVLSADQMNRYVDPLSKCLLFAPITNYRSCPGRPYTGITNGEAAAIAGASMFGLMMIVQLCICAKYIPRAKLLVQPSKQQIVYVESPQPAPQIIEKVIERSAPQPVSLQVLDDRLISQHQLPDSFLPGLGQTATLPQGYSTISAPVPQGFAQR